MNPKDIKNRLIIESAVGQCSESSRITSLMPEKLRGGLISIIASTEIHPQIRNEIFHSNVLIVSYLECDKTSHVNLVGFIVANLPKRFDSLDEVFSLNNVGFTYTSPSLKQNENDYVLSQMREELYRLTQSLKEST